MSSAIREGWFSKIVVLDLAPSLCEVARKRAEEKWPGVVSVVCGDACNAKEKGLPPGVQLSKCLLHASTGTCSVFD